jgi:hypothetical protein
MTDAPGMKAIPQLWLRPWILLLLSMVAVGFYLLAGSRLAGPGFPLDDAWIHQTYARSLAVYGEWAFIPGQPSAGSTAPLWSLLLSVGHALGVGPYPWTFVLGVLLLWGLAWLGMLLFDRLCPDCNKYKLAAGIFLVFEWHMVWAAASGMETLFQAIIVLLVLLLLLVDQVRWLLIGLLIGLSTWVRPDGITLLGPALLVLAVKGESWRQILRTIVVLASGFGALFLPYLLFNQQLAGSWWPNTFFAKQAEYAVELNTSLLSRMWEQAALPMVGAGVLLLPGFVYVLFVYIRQKDWTVLTGPIWFAGYLAMYALRLPVTYQHGRYLMPAMPVYFLWGLSGFALILTKLPTGKVYRITGRVWLVSILVVWGAFYVVGAKAYSTDVAVIKTEMVATARWVAENTPPGALVAAHDIGALGYFSGRPLLDLAGLVSPQVIPFIRDQEQLAAYLDKQQADYLVTFPGWYPLLVRELHPVYQSHGTIAPEIGGENMVVYRWRKNSIKTLLLKSKRVLPGKISCAILFPER